MYRTFGFACALALVCGALVHPSQAQDQPIKRTELIRADVADVAGKETVIYIADVIPGGEGARHTHYGDGSFTFSKARSLSPQTAKSQ